MTKFYGQLAGVQGQTLRSGVGLASAAPISGGSPDPVLWRDALTLAGNVVGDTISLALLRPTAFVNIFTSYIAYGACGAGVTLSIGDVNYPAGLRAPFSVAAASFNSLAPAPAAALIVAPLWQRLGYPANPGVPIELLATFGGVNPANVDMGWTIFGRNF